MSGTTRLTVASAPVDLLGLDDALSLLAGRARRGGARPLAVASVNLDHVHHFGTGGRWCGALSESGGVDWLHLVDGAPVVSAVRRTTGERWPRLAGSDLIGPLLDRAELDGMTVGFFGGSAETHARLREELARTRPALRIGGCWAPARDELADPARAAALADEVAGAGVDVLVVSLGKPRQELWIQEHGGHTGAGLLLAFGAVVDFLAGRVERAPAWIARGGLEWAWRLLLEPRRLARRYLVDGPGAYRALRRPGAPDPSPVAEHPADPTPLTPGRFAGPDDRADVAALVVTYDSAADIEPLLDSLRAETDETALRVVVVDNSPDDRTLAALRRHGDITAVPSGGNLGYAGGINVARRLAGDARALLVLNPDLSVERGAIAALLRRLDASGAGIVVPAMRGADGAGYPSLRREPTAWRTVGDALFGRRLPGRPGWLGEIDYDAESYAHAHPIVWATGAALLIRRELADRLGDWDERFFLYSEETDYFRRAREAGASAWFEPAAVARHRRGGSGASGALIALMMANRLRYAQKVGPRAAAARMRAALLLHETLRLPIRSHRAAFRAIVSRRSWSRLPHATLTPPEPPAGCPAGSIIIPAHDEEAVIGRTLEALAELSELDQVEVIVVCNGCTDRTARLARGFAGVRVIDLSAASKVAALNAGDARATRWPRLYLDADVVVPAQAVRLLFTELGREGAPLAARPAFRYDVSGASAAVRAYYRARGRMPATRSALWGAGAYALSRAGHARFTRFPEVIGDDLWVDGLFAAGEKRVLDTPPAIVRTPRTAAALLATLRRTSRGNAESGVSTAGDSLRQLLASVRGPRSAADAAAYAWFALAGRRQTGPGARWERDLSSRTGVPHES